MATITSLFDGVQLDNLIKLFCIQIALALIIIAFLIKGVVARIIIRIVYSFTKNNKKARESEMYVPLKRMVVIFAMYVASRIIPKGERVTYIINEIFKTIVILFVTKLITTMIYSDSKFLKKFLKKSESDKVNDFLCKILRGLVWIISIIVIVNELGYLRNISGLITGLGFASAIIALAAQELVKNLLSRSFYSYR